MEKVFFVHINQHTNTPSKAGVPRKKLPPPSYTLAAVLRGTNLHIGISRCSPRDQFVKKVGRIRAEGRAKSSAAIVIDVPQEVVVQNTIGKFFSEVSRRLVSEPSVDN